MRGPRGAKRALKCYVSTPSLIEALEGRRVLIVPSLCIRQAKLVREILEPDLKLVAVAVDGTTPATAFAGGIQQDRTGIFGGVGAPVPVI